VTRRVRSMGGETTAARARRLASVALAGYGGSIDAWALTEFFVAGYLACERDTCEVPRGR
jgi:hypothetical protein